MSETKDDKKELDFDELHQAVNKLMDQAQKPKIERHTPTKAVPKAATRPPLKVAQRPASRVESDKKELQTNEKKTVKQSQEKSGSVPVRHVARPPVTMKPKKRGVAMDVIQASKPAVIKPPSATPPRVGKSLQPTKPVIPEPPSPRAASSTKPATQNQPQQQNDVSEDMLKSIDMQADGTTRQPVISLPAVDAAHEATFPDPLEIASRDMPNPEEPSMRAGELEQASEPKKTMQHSIHGSVPTEQPVTDNKPLPKNDDVTYSWEMPENSKGTAPLQPIAETTQAPSMAPAAASAIPFVHAQVQKRPLGAYANTTPASLAPAFQDATSKTQPAPQPSLTHTAAPPVPPTVGIGQPTSPPVLESPEELGPEVVAVESAEPEFTPSAALPPSEATPLQNLRNMSIPRQYSAHEKEPSSDDRPVFDTKNYHTPLQPAPVVHQTTSHGSKIGIVLTIVLVVLLIAAILIAYCIATGMIKF